MSVVAKSRGGVVRAVTQPIDIARAVSAIGYVPPQLRMAVRAHLIRKARGIAGASRHIPPHWHPSGKIRQVSSAHAVRLAAAAGVTLDLSNADIDLAGKWKHGWIPLDAVAAAIKAKKGIGSSGRSPRERDLRSVGVRSKGRAGKAVMDSRRGSLGRTKIGKGAVPKPRAVAEHRDGPGGRAHIADPASLSGGHIGGNDPAELAKLLSTGKLHEIHQHMPGTPEGRHAKAELDRRERQTGGTVHQLPKPISPATRRAQDHAIDRSRAIQNRQVREQERAEQRGAPSVAAEQHQRTIFSRMSDERLAQAEARQRPSPWMSRLIAEEKANRGSASRGLGTKTPDFGNPNRSKSKSTHVVQSDVHGDGRTDRYRLPSGHEVQVDRRTGRVNSGDLYHERHASGKSALDANPSEFTKHHIGRSGTLDDHYTLKAHDPAKSASENLAGAGSGRLSGTDIHVAQQRGHMTAQQAKVEMAAGKLPADSRYGVEKGGTGWHAVLKGSNGQSSHSIGFHKTKKAATAHALDRHNSDERAQAASPSLAELDAADAAKGTAKARPKADEAKAQKPRKGDLALLSQTHRNAYIGKASDTTESHKLVKVGRTSRDGQITHYSHLDGANSAPIAVPRGATVKSISRGKLDEAAVVERHSGFYNDQFPSEADAKAALLRHSLSDRREPAEGVGLTMNEKRFRQMSVENLRAEARGSGNTAAAARAELQRRGK